MSEFVRRDEAAADSPVLQRPFVFFLPVQLDAEAHGVLGGLYGLGACDQRHADVAGGDPLAHLADQLLRRVAADLGVDGVARIGADAPGDGAGWILGAAETVSDPRPVGGIGEDTDHRQGADMGCQRRAKPGVRHGGLCRFGGNAHGRLGLVGGNALFRELSAADKDGRRVFHGCPQCRPCSGS